MISADVTSNRVPHNSGAISTACYHCGEPMVSNVRLWVVTSAGREPVCCTGCQAVAQTILGNGLADYYRHRERPADRVDVARAITQKQFTLYDDPAVQRSFVRHIDDTTLEATLMLSGIHCAACVWLNARHLSRIRGVHSVSVNYTTQRAVVRWNDRVVRLSSILCAVADIGYQAFPYDVQQRQKQARTESKAWLSRIFVAGVGMMQVMMYAVPAYLANGDMSADIEQLMRVASLLLTLPVVLYSAQPFFGGAWRDLKSRRLGMDIPVALGIGAAFIASVIVTAVGHGEVYFDSITMFVFFLLAGRLLEKQARQRAAIQLENATRNLPVAAIRLPGYPNILDEEHIAAAALIPGDHVLVRPGDTIPADGIVLEGLGEVNESLLSGESAPLPKRPGGTLIAGAVNVASPLIMRVAQVGPHTLLSTLALLAERAAGERPRITRVADKVANHFVLGLLILATVVGALWLWFAPDRALATVISLLVVSCPCALSLAAPAALTAGTARLLRDGLLVTRADAIESLANATHFVFDKTATLTEGNMRLTQVTPLGSCSADDCLKIAQALQRLSEHPIARAIRTAPSLQSTQLNVTQLINVPGRGIEASVDGVSFRMGTSDFVAELVARPLPAHGTPDDAATAVLLGSDHEWLGRYAFHDRPRHDAKPLVAALQAMGKQVILLSGDAPAAVHDTACRLGILKAHARMTPQRKLEYIRTLQRQGAVVAMVGDGINDAPVLAGADVSIAMGSGTELAKIHADIVLIAPRMLALHQGVLTARQALRIIKQNLAWAFAYNFAAIPLAALGLVTPWMAALGMSASSLLVVLNAVRLNNKTTVEMPHPVPILALRGT